MLCEYNYMQLLYAVIVISMRMKRLRKAQIEYQITYSYLGTIVTGDFDEALIAINDREVDDLGVC